MNRIILIFITASAISVIYGCNHVNNTHSIAKEQHTSDLAETTAESDSIGIQQPIRVQYTIS